jgi:dihydroxy-acid dehydratase
MTGNLFHSAIMKTSVISEEFRQRYLSNPQDLNAFEGRAIVFTGPEEFHKTIDDPSLNIDENCVLIMRGAGPIGYPGGAEVVNMRPPSYLLEKGIHSLPCIGDGRQSGTSGSPSILNASPEAADGGGLALLKNNDMIRVDLNKFTVDVLIDDAELKSRKENLDVSFLKPESQTPWQDIFREKVNPFSEGMTLKGADKHKNIAAHHLPRDNH